MTCDEARAKGRIDVSPTLNDGRCPTGQRADTPTRARPSTSELLAVPCTSPPPPAAIAPSTAALASGRGSAAGSTVSVRTPYSGTPRRTSYSYVAPSDVRRRSTDASLVQCPGPPWASPSPRVSSRSAPTRVEPSSDGRN